MAFKMKAGKEGPMKKNFPKVFAKKFDKDYEPQTKAGGREYEDRVRRSDLDEKGKKIFDSKGYNPQTNKKNTKSTSYKPEDGKEGVDVLYLKPPRGPSEWEGKKPRKRKDFLSKNPNQNLA